MKISHEEEVTQIQEIIDDIICNKCGKSCNLAPSTENKDFYGLTEFCYSGGWYSDPLSDGCNYTFSLCEQCLFKLFVTFVHKVKITSYIGCAVLENEAP